MKIYFASHLAGVKKQQSVYRLFSLVCGVQMPYFNQISCSKHGSTDTIKMLSGAVSIIAIIASTGPIFAQSFTVTNGEVLGSGKSMLNPGDKGVVEQGGVIFVPAAAAVGVVATGADAVVENHGTITMSGFAATGIATFGTNSQVINTGTVTTFLPSSTSILATGTGSTVTNSGELVTKGDDSHGIQAQTGTNIQITNSGTIDTTGSASNGVNSTGVNALITNAGSGIIKTTNTSATAILSTGDGSTAVNNGTISTTGNAALGIQLIGSGGVTATNNGSITTSGDFAPGISVSGTNSQAIVNGVVSTSGDSSYGVNAFGLGTSVTHNGTINTSGPNASGILVDGLDSKAIISGRVFSALGNAIEFASVADNELRLLPGTVLQGGLVFGGGTDTLNVANGLSLHYTFDKAPDILNTNGAPSLVQGNVVDVIDTTSFAHIDNSLDALLAGTFNMLAKPKTSNANAEENPNALGYAQSPTNKWPEGADWQAEDHSRVWANGFAGLQSNNASGSATQANTVFGGGVIGVESMLDPEFTAGAFVGFGAAQLSTPGNTQTVDAKGQYAGLYGQIGGHIDLAITGGVLQHTSSRQILNNLAATGIETVTADFNGYFVAPEVTFNLLETDFGGKPTRTSLRGRYTFQHIDGYTENGADSILTVGARDVHALDTRLKVEADLVNDNETLVTARAGVDGQFNWGANSVTANLLGTNLTFDPGGAPISGSAFVGLTANKQLNENTNLYFDTELTSGTAHGFGITAQAGFKSSF
ncbi:autotransporter domain-containing protein [Maritalea porphyrae]|uniref:autotransporter domain-containing protein n=2 Tax=Maritalea porphyrae TaxID=880732 RepID=UPI0035EBB52B